MSNLCRLSEAQMARLQPFFLKGHVKPRVADLRALIGVTFINRSGLRRCKAPKEHGPTPFTTTGSAGVSQAKRH